MLFHIPDSIAKAFERVYKEKMESQTIRNLKARQAALEALRNASKYSVDAKYSKNKRANAGGIEGDNDNPNTGSEPQTGTEEENERSFELNQDDEDNEMEGTTSLDDI